MAQRVIEPGESTGPAAVLRSTTARTRWTAALLASVVVIIAVAPLRHIVATRADVGTDLAPSLRWPVIVLLVGLAALHYVASTVAARAVSGRRTPFGETFLTQLAAAAANRITPAGLGGSAVLARYFNRRAAMDTAAAIGAVTALATFGALADLTVLGALTALGATIGLGGGASEFASLASHIGRLAHLLASSAPAVAALLAVIGIAWFVLLRHRHRHASRRRIADQGHRFVRSFLYVAQRPRALLALVLASGSTTLILGIAFALTPWLLPGPRPAVSAGALVVGYMLAAGVAGAVPAGFGTAEAAMTAVLVSAHVPTAHALTDVVCFRVITFWAPAVVGVLAARRLRRSAAI